MKTSKLLLLALFLMAFGTSFGQLKGVNLSMGGGITVAKVNCSGYYSAPSEATARSSFGFFADKKIKHGLSVRTGLFYNGLGESYNSANKDMQDEFNYMSIPVQLVLAVPTTPLSIYAGPQASYLLNASRKTGGNSIVMVTDEFRKIMVTGTAGVLCKLSPRFNLGVEYERSFYNSITKEFADNIQDGSKYQPVGISFRAYYRISK